MQNLHFCGYTIQRPPVVSVSDIFNMYLFWLLKPDGTAKKHMHASLHVMSILPMYNPMKHVPCINYSYFLQNSLLLKGLGWHTYKQHKHANPH